MVEMMTAIPALFHKTMRAQQTQMLRNAGARQFKRVGQRIHVLLTFAQLLDHPDAIRMGDDLEHFGELSRD